MCGNAGHIELLHRHAWKGVTARHSEALAAIVGHPVTSTLINFNGRSFKLSWRRTAAENALTRSSTRRPECCQAASCVTRLPRDVNSAISFGASKFFHRNGFLGGVVGALSIRTRASSHENTPWHKLTLDTTHCRNRRQSLEPHRSRPIDRADFVRQLTHSRASCTLLQVLPTYRAASPARRSRRLVWPDLQRSQNTQATPSGGVCL